MTAGTTAASSSTEVVVGSARTVKATGPIASSLGVTVIEADGSRR